MVKQKMLEVLEREYIADAGGKHLSLSIRRSRRRRSRRVLEAAPRTEADPMTSVGSVRNRMVLQEMRLVYNQLVGTGDQLVDMKLASVLPRFDGVGCLGRVELQAINYDLARQVSEIYGHQIARRAYDRIGGLIAKVFS